MASNRRAATLAIKLADGSWRIRWESGATKDITLEGGRFTVFGQSYRVITEMNASFLGLRAHFSWADGTVQTLESYDEQSHCLTWSTTHPDHPRISWVRADVPSQVLADPDDAPPRSVTHTEGTSYIVAFGHPELFPIPGSEHFVFGPFPAAGGHNPYQPESGVMHAIYTEIQEVGQSWTIHSVPPSVLCRISTTMLLIFYDALRGLSERSRGLRFVDLLDCMKTLLTYQHAAAVLRHIGGGTEQDNTGTLVVAIIMMALARGCQYDKTLTACSATLEPTIFEGSPPPATLGAGWTEYLYFNLSDRERKRLRRFDNGVRRMPYVLARQLILRKAPKKGAHGPARRLVRRSFMPDSEELFRVVVSFL